MNLLDLALLKELGRLLDDVQDDEAIRVLVFESADPDFFLAHYDMQELLTRPVITEKTKALKPFYQLLERYRTLPQVTIASIDGCVRGAGSEFVLALDMRFASSERAVFGQLEVRKRAIQARVVALNKTMPTSVRCLAVRMAKA